MRTTTASFWQLARLTTGQNYRPFEWGLRLWFKPIRPNAIAVRITVHLNEDYDTISFLQLAMPTTSELPSIWMRTTTLVLPLRSMISRGQNYRPFEWGLRHQTIQSSSSSFPVRITVHLNEDYDSLTLPTIGQRPTSELPSIWMRTTTTMSHIGSS